MADVTRYVPGDFCWPELATSDADAAKRFYSALFGWETADMPAGPDMTYTMCRLRGRDAAALYRMGPQEAGLPPRWNTYLTVESADASAARAAELGGKVLMPPFDVMDVGRMAVVSDPEGAAFCLWQPARHVGATVRNEAGAFGWNELHTRRKDDARRFYAGLFPSWTIKPSKHVGAAYDEVWIDGRPVGGLMDASELPAEVPSFWLTYFEVASCDDVVGRALAGGGKKIMGPHAVAGVGRFAILADPQGAVFAVIELEKRK